MFQQAVDVIRELPGIYHLRRARYKRIFFSGKSRSWALWGAYRSMDEARAQIGDPAKATYDNKQIVDVNLDWFSRVSLFDYPVIYWLARLLNERKLRSLVDFGGHIGVKYYAYRDHLSIPEDFLWQVVDVPAMIERGKQKADSQGLQALKFFDDISAAQPCELLFCSGSLQYAPNTIDEVVSKMTSRPKYIVINKLGVLPDRELVSLENFESSWIPYRIHSLQKFNQSLVNIDYKLVDSWAIEERTYDVPFIEEAKNIKSVGQVWVCKRSNPLG